MSERAALEQVEAHLLERMESKCATQGQHAVATRVKGSVVYTCASAGASAAKPR